MSDNNWWFLDLAAVVAATGFLSFGLLLGVPGAARVVFALPLVLFLPGYALIAVLFPDAPSDDYQPFDIDRTGLRNPLLVSGGLASTERIILSIVASIFLVPVIALLASVAPRGIAPETVILGIAGLTGLLTLFAIVARYRCAPDRRFALTVGTSGLLFSHSGRSTGVSPRPFNIAIIFALLILVATTGFAVANPPTSESYTEFAFETEPVTADTDTVYQTNYAAGEASDVTVSITNHEGTEQTYTTVVLLERVSYGESDVTVQERTQLTSESVTLADGEQQNQTLEMTPSMQGDDLRLTVLLYEGEPPSDPSTENAYRAVHAPIVVE
ncbi:DUF1616 domain-containing protein [Saliphagus sp. GCM10025317]